MRCFLLQEWGLLSSDDCAICCVSDWRGRYLWGSCMATGQYRIVGCSCGHDAVENLCSLFWVPIWHLGITPADMMGHILNPEQVTEPFEGGGHPSWLESPRTGLVPPGWQGTSALSVIPGGWWSSSGVTPSDIVLWLVLGLAHVCGCYCVRTLGGFQAVLERSCPKSQAGGEQLRVGSLSALCLGWDCHLDYTKLTSEKGKNYKHGYSDYILKI